MKKPTKEQIEAWKAEYGKIYELVAEDGKMAIIHDPLFSFPKVKLAFTSLNSGGSIAFAVSVLTNCWLDGDPEVLAEEKYGNGLSDQIDELTTIPDYVIDRKETDGAYTITVEGKSLRVTLAKRDQIMEAERRNASSEPFQTAAYLLDVICVDKKELEEVKKQNRIYMGFLRATNKVKDKVYVRVKKL